MMAVFVKQHPFHWFCNLCHKSKKYKDPKFFGYFSSHVGLISIVLHCVWMHIYGRWLLDPSCWVPIFPEWYWWSDISVIYWRQEKDMKKHNIARNVEIYFFWWPGLDSSFEENIYNKKMYSPAGTIGQLFLAVLSWNG